MPKANIQVYLASKSPRRAELLSQLGINFDVLNIELDESVKSAESAQKYVERLAIEKASAGFDLASIKHIPVIGSDTCIVHRGEIIGKPLNPQHATEILKRLSGEWHEVKTSVAICDELSLVSIVQTSRVLMREIHDEELARYISSGESLDKAGGYAIQGRAAVFIERIEGSYSGIMGLPLFETAQLLLKFHINCI